MHNPSDTTRPILCVDFDGVIHRYTGPWAGACKIDDPPVEGALDFLAEATNHFRVNIFSSRSNEPGGIEAMKAWMKYWAYRHLFSADDHHFVWPWIELLEWPLTKPPFAVGLDDRVITFKGEWPSMEELKNFKPWNKKQETKHVEEIQVERERANSRELRED